MLEHPEIGWIQRTGYPSHLQPGVQNERRIKYDQSEIPVGIRLLKAARENQRLSAAALSAPAASGKQDRHLPSG
jgi:hypothetical protein